MNDEKVTFISFGYIVSILPFRDSTMVLAVGLNRVESLRSGVEVRKWRLTRRMKKKEENWKMNCVRRYASVINQQGCCVRPLLAGLTSLSAV